MKKHTIILLTLILLFSVSLLMATENRTTTSSSLSTETNLNDLESVGNEVQGARQSTERRVQNQNQNPGSGNDRNDTAPSNQSSPSSTSSSSSSSVPTSSSSSVQSQPARPNNTYEEERTNTNTPVRQDRREIELESSNTPNTIWESSSTATDRERTPATPSQPAQERSAYELRYERVSSPISRDSERGVYSGDQIQRSNASGMIGYGPEDLVEPIKQSNISSALLSFIDRYIQEYREAVAELYAELTELLPLQKAAMIENNFDKVARLEFEIYAVRNKINVIRIEYLEKIYYMLSYNEREELTNAGFSL